MVELVEDCVALAEDLGVLVEREVVEDCVVLVVPVVV